MFMRRLANWTDLKSPVLGGALVKHWQARRGVTGLEYVYALKV